MTAGEHKLTELSRGWVWTSLGELVDPSKEKVIPQERADSRYIGLEHIEKNTGDLLGYGSSRDVRSTKTLFHQGDILYGKLRPYLNKVHFAEFDGVCSTDILVFTKDENLCGKYLTFRLLCPDFVRFANLNVSGVQHPRVDFDKVAGFPIPLPPLAEQKRIVAKIEELFTRLDAGVEALKKVRQELKRYRQAVLKYAFEGKLTAKWREKNKDKLEPASKFLERIAREREKNAKGKAKKLPPLDTSELPELPTDWEWARIGDLGEVVTGTTPSKTKSEYYGSSFPFYKPTDLNEGYYVKRSADGLSKMGLEQARLLPEKSVLVTCIGATIGKTGFIRVAGASNQQINAIIPEKWLSPEYIYFCCISTDFQKTIFDNASATTLPILNKGKFELLALPISSVQEQKRIVDDIDRHFSIADEVGQTIEKYLKEAERLRQSILKRAFEGKLVPQDPADEPVEKLLERIKAEKAKLQQMEKVKKRKGAK